MNGKDIALHQCTECGGADKLCSEGTATIPLYREDADYTRLLEDKKRLDWLADRENTIGNVMLPVECVAAHIDDLRAAIDMAMGDL